MTDNLIRIKYTNWYTKFYTRAKKQRGYHLVTLDYLAEAQRFELWNPFGSPVFKTGAFNRSATLPE